MCDAGYVYLDVRTNEEVAQGAPVDCVNVPAFARTDDGMMPMASTFMKLVGVNFPDKDVKIVVGCASGNVSFSFPFTSECLLARCHRLPVSAHSAQTTTAFQERLRLACRGWVYKRA